MSLIPFPTLRVSDNARFLCYADGAPFFYLADTAWELFHRCSRAEIEIYLQDRAQKGFNVVQAVVLAEIDGLNTPNAEGEVPFHDLDVARPNEAYFELVDWAIDRANQLGITLGLLPTWGDKWNLKWGAGPEVFTPENATIYGEWLSRRYRDKDLIWIVGGDRPLENDQHRTIVENMARGLRRGDNGRHLTTLHPCGRQTSAQNFHTATWLDFNMWQSGHGRNRDNYTGISADYALEPTKPTLDGEPGYEDHPADFSIDNGYLDDYDSRKAAYWSVFSGACGHTYGCHPIWQMFAPGRAAISSARRFWPEALQLPGASQMQHLKTLMLSRPYFSRIPDQNLIVSDVGEKSHHVRATRDQNGSYALIYFPLHQEVVVNLEVLSGERLRATWFDPRTGKAQVFDSFTRSGQRAFEPPFGGPDWVLVLDDENGGFEMLGQKNG